VFVSLSFLCCSFLSFDLIHFRLEFAFNFAFTLTLEIFPAPTCSLLVGDRCGIISTRSLPMFPRRLLKQVFVQPLFGETSALASVGPS
jgi:hypothetical protein